MKPKYKQNLGQLIKYYYANYDNYHLKIYIDGKLKYDNALQLVEFFGHDYLNVVEFFRNDSAKTISVYTSKNIC
ncbi:hypothetical protein [Clostridium magnum]|uniref:Uncharacterized protein n=1 Tax=Clostridium magnum DSM 2767 TaxID=1121326 RepID=A0A162SPQ3_9CLOT|nr:hypothetical protein [Clostridium magnum]KZL91707.1 hypothetical protein CLMAG_34660 [Clostridium magnum DSM 2767]SHJ39279.1 hypothetical protein SAMN02745944_05883 [Clostridium magnum DSM 2767]